MLWLRWLYLFGFTVFKHHPPFHSHTESSTLTLTVTCQQPTSITTESLDTAELFGATYQPWKGKQTFWGLFGSLPVKSNDSIWCAKLIIFWLYVLKTERNSNDWRALHYPKHPSIHPAVHHLYHLSFGGHRRAGAYPSWNWSCRLGSLGSLKAVHATNHMTVTSLHRETF